MLGVRIAGRGVRDTRVLEVMRDVPREKFVDPGFEELTYEDSALQFAPVRRYLSPTSLHLCSKRLSYDPPTRC
jgi:protein-L-isoaspartate O-methyltransferase